MNKLLLLIVGAIAVSATAIEESTQQLAEAFPENEEVAAAQCQGEDCQSAELAQVDADRRRRLSPRARVLRTYRRHRARLARAWKRLHAWRRRHARRWSKYSKKTQRRLRASYRRARRSLRRRMTRLNRWVRRALKSHRRRSAAWRRRRAA
jgi:hypothetical protein